MTCALLVLPSTSRRAGGGAGEAPPRTSDQDGLTTRGTSHQGAKGGVFGAGVRHPSREYLLILSLRHVWGY